MSGRTKLGYLVAGIAVALVAQGLPFARTGVADENHDAGAIRARSLEIVNEDGVVVARVASDESGGVVQLFDSDGRPRRPLGIAVDAYADVEGPDGGRGVIRPPSNDGPRRARVGTHTWLLDEAAERR